MIAKKEKAKKLKEQKLAENVEENMEKEDEFDENEHREAIKLNELMQELKLEADNEEEEMKKLENVCKDIDKMDLTGLKK